MARTAGLVLVGVLCVATPAPAQRFPLTGYLLNVAAGAGEGPFTGAGLLDFQRGRVMFRRQFGVMAVDVAYELRLAYQSAADAAGLAVGLGQVTGTAWLPLQGDAEISDHWSWAHRADRLSLGFAAERVELVVGRQPISWATTILLTPADPFAPFEPAEPFREYRAGVDAVRVRLFAGPFTELEAVLRPSDTALGETVTALARGATRFGRVDVSGWAGVVHDEPAAAFAAAVSAAGAVARVEGSLRRTAGATVVRFALGIDRSFVVANRTLYLIGEYQHDALGARDAADLPRVLASSPVARGELQVVGRDVFAVQGSYDVHPLVGLQLLGIWNAGDQSLLVAPAASYSATSNSTLRAGLFAGFGRGRATTGGPGSEYGPVPVIGYLAVSAFL